MTHEIVAEDALDISDIVSMSLSGATAVMAHFFVLKKHR